MADTKCDLGVVDSGELASKTKISLLSELADVLDLFDLNIRRAADRGAELPHDLDTKLSEMHALSYRAIESDQADGEYTVAATGMLYLIRYLRDRNLSDFEAAFKLNCTAKDKLGEKWRDPFNPSWQMLHIYLSWVRKDILGKATGLKASLPPHVSESQPGFQRADIIPIPDFPEIQSITHDAFPPDTSNPDHLCMIATALVRRFEIFHDRDDIDKAVEYGLKAISSLSSSSSPPSSQALYHHRLTTSLLNRFDFFKVESDIYDAAQYNMLTFRLLADVSVSESFRDSLELQVDSILIRLTSVNSNTFDNSFAAKVTEFDEFCISFLRPSTPVMLMARLTLANFYESCFLQSGGSDPTHIHKVIEHCSGILGSESVFLNSEYRSACLYQLATAYQHRFTHSQADSDWDLHIHYLEAYAQFLEAPVNINQGVVEKLKDAHRRLALALIQRFGVTKDPSDREAAKRSHELSVHGLDPNSWHPHDHLFLAALSFSEILEGGDRASLEDGISRVRQSLEGIVDLNGGQTLPQSLLAHAFSAYYEWAATHSRDSAARCIDISRDIATSETGPDTRLRAAVLWGQIAFVEGRPECLDAFHIAASLSLEVMSLQLGNKLEERYDAPWRLLRNVHAMAASAALAFQGKVDLAIEYYEQGLSINYRQLLQLRSEIRELELIHPALAQKLSTTSAKLLQLSREAPPDFMELEPAALSDVKMSIAAEYRTVVAEIRAKPGFDRLFLALPYQQLSTAAGEGPIIMLTHEHEKFGDALVMLGPTRAPIALGLPAVTQEAVNRFTRKLATLLHRCNALRGAERGGRPSKPPILSGSIDSSEFKEILEWLRVGIVDPIFKELVRNGITKGRIWWCPSSVFTRFPIHAAAPVDCPFTQSYTYTLESLIKARNASLNDVGICRQAQIAAVGVSQYKGHSSLGCVSQELQMISELAKGQSSWLQLTKLEDQTAQVEPVLNAIKASHIVHLACHGKQNRDKPLESGLVLNDGMLTLERLLAEDLRQAQFVFLSACQTATGDEKQRSESLHLAGGFMAAGFKGAIGTLWGIYDSDAPIVAKIIYETIISEEGIDIRKGAEGLQKAVRYLREKGVSHERWVPYIHVGV